MGFRSQTLKGLFAISVNNKALSVIFKYITSITLHPDVELGIQIL